MKSTLWRIFLSHPIALCAGAKQATSPETSTHPSGKLSPERPTRVTALAPHPVDRTGVYLWAVGTPPRLWPMATSYRRKPNARPKYGLETIMIFGHKSPIKNHLSSKHPTFTHKVMARNPHEQNLEMERQEESPPERNPPPRAERSEPIPIRY